MLFPKRDAFLDKVITYIKFPFDRSSIRLELKNHIDDKIQEYMKDGYHREKAEETAINEMGDPKEIGVLLNKEHNPFIGWIWKITSIGVIIFGIFNLIYIIFPAVIGLFNSNLMNHIPKDHIVYRINVNEKVTMDDKVIVFNKVVYDINDNLTIFYKHYDKIWSTSGNVLGLIDEISDDLGNVYFSGGGTVYGGIVSKGALIFRNFSSEAKILYLKYDRFNRKYEIEIPLKVGDYYE
ncbi:hypothetical protein EDC18_103361 [Natranaerovirga pectinivora]|uniref:Uncharacterized protein n=1 Tax=Natranaerovirga pectinivora TaxID=682400 RepID=A0A4R3MLR7_9FIRM|nr:permease prefix domain 1-containing protein [Natranaerovirga pectinivora]TCT15652.1 hypothetical protein EDC18_103361 [Natranaerovirga pectinivora]